MTIKIPPRLAKSIERVARSMLAAVGADEPLHEPEELASPISEHPEPIPAGAPVRFARELRPSSLQNEQGRAAEALYSRLTREDTAEIEGRIDQIAELGSHYASISDRTIRQHLILAAGVWLGVPAVIEKTKLLTAQPPDAIHAMARGPMAAGGGFYEADLVVDALASAGVGISSIHNALDFGCSSGRVVRVLAAAYPDVRWRGCDPNGPAIAWASESLSGIDFFSSGDEPPLPLVDGSMDLVYAISIWSHFAPELGLRWFEEMRRLIRPGGYLVCTTHGFTSVEFYVTRELRTPLQSDEIVGALYERGWWYAPEFGESGDWGVVNPEWGTAFLGPEWLLAQLCPHWRVLEFAPGRNQWNQDVYVLQRV